MGETLKGPRLPVTKIHQHSVRGPEILAVSGGSENSPSYERLALSVYKVLNEADQPDLLNQSPNQQPKVRNLALEVAGVIREGEPNTGDLAQLLDAEFEGQAGANIEDALARQLGADITEDLGLSLPDLDMVMLLQRRRREYNFCASFRSSPASCGRSCNC